jgi:hypothetical protein
MTGLQIADFRLQIGALLCSLSIRNLQSEICNLQSRQEKLARRPHFPLPALADQLV